MSDYNHKSIEQKWQQTWADNGTFTIADKKPGAENEYVLVEFPYPSGNLHVGHWYAFAITDIYARYRRMLGNNVLFPIGFDAFGLPAENAAIKRGLNPRTWTYDNMAHMEKQMKMMGASFDWSRKIASCDPEYYKWTQWLFTKFLEKGLAYQSETNVNWCPSCKTVLANEQVKNGRCERCDNEVVQKKMKQWQFKITDYADRLVDDLEGLDWADPIKDAQRNWIGRSEGAKINFAIEGRNETIEVFTTRADTLFGVTYLVLAPEHELVAKFSDAISNKVDVDAYILATSKKTEMDRQTSKEKTGVRLDGIFAINPANNEKVHVFIADYVLAGYGTGAIMAVPAHDERDNEFAKKFDLEIRPVVSLYRIDTTNPPRADKKTVTRNIVHVLIRNPKDNTILCLKWKQQPWTTFVVGGVEDGEDMIDAARREALEETGYKNLKFVKVINSQPVKSEYFANHKDENRIAYSHAIIFELENDDRVEVSDDEKAKHEVVWMTLAGVEKTTMACSEKGIWVRGLKGENVDMHSEKGILVNSGEFNGLSSDEALTKIVAKVGGHITRNYRLRDWLISRQRYWGCPIPVIHCAKCGAVPVPEKDLPVVLPELENFTPRDDGKSPLAKATAWMNVPCPQCGAPAERESDTLDTFIDSSWYFLRYTDPKNSTKFADADKIASWMPVAFYSGGAEHTTMHLLFARFFQKVLFDLGLVKNVEPFKHRLNRSLILGPDGNKMSKSKGNVIDPDELVERLGADTVRLYLSFIGPYNETSSYPWDPNGVVGVRRFLERVWRVSEKLADTTDAEVTKQLHKVIKRVGEEVQQLKFNAAIAQLMAFCNVIEKKGIAAPEFSNFIKMLSVMAPHIAEEMWAKIGNTTLVTDEAWPTFDPAMIIDETVKVTVQVNGKVRATIEVAPDISEAEITEKILALADVQKWINGAAIKKTIYIKGKIFSIVL